MMHIEVLLLISVLLKERLKSGDKIRMMATGKEFEVIEVGVHYTESDCHVMN